MLLVVWPPKISNALSNRIVDGNVILSAGGVYRPA
jgi:hypothetical protein